METLYSDCVYRLSSFHTPQGQEIPINSAVSPSYLGSPLHMDDIGEGSQATITLKPPSHITHIEITTLHPASSPLRSLFHEGIIVFSRYLFPTIYLEPEYRDKSLIKVISSRFPGIRKVNNAGNNGFWTAVGVAYLEHLANPVVSETELEGFVEKLKEIGEECKELVGFLGDLRGKRRKEGGNWVENRAEDRNLQRELVKGLKTLTIQYATYNPQDPSVQSLNFGLEGLETQLFYTKTLDFDVIRVLCKALSIRLGVYNVDSEFCKTVCGDKSEKCPYLNLLNHYEAYYILYSRGNLQVQGYDLRTHTRTPQSAVRPALLRSVYSSAPFPNPTTNLSITRHISFNDSLYQVITSALNAIKLHHLSHIFFNAPLCTHTQNAINRHSEIISALQNYQLMEEFPNSSYGNFANIAVSALNICGICGSRPVFWQFACGHMACRECLSSHVNELYRELPFLLSPKGDPVKQVRCLHRECEYVLSKEEFVQITSPETYSQLLREAEAVTLKKYCQNCDSEREAGSFLYPHPCKLCSVCVVDRILRYNSICPCGELIPSAIKQTLQTLKLQCAMCGEVKSQLDQFTHAVCQEHQLLCRDCLELAVSSGRCTLCHRLFTSTEKQEYQFYFLRPCDLKCGRTFPKSESVPLHCRCHYCFDCAKELVRSTLNCTTCVLCKKHSLYESTKAVFEKEYQIRNFAIKIKARDTYRKAEECAICLNYIGSRYEYLLSCSHIFHRACLQDYLNTYTDSVIQKPAFCPKCSVEIEGNVIHEMLSEQKFHKYNRLLMEITLHIRTCPKCGMKFEYQLAKNISSITCPACFHCFCSICSDIWTSTHDSTMCKYMEIQSQIKVLEGEGAQGQKIAQCPGCKIPYLKDEKCEHVICVNNLCKMHWCFECSAPREPILAHHNQWHRPSCRFYVRVKSKVKEKPSQTCPNCRALGRLCEPPKDLKVPRRFSLEEY